MTAIADEGGRNGETLEWAKIFWSNFLPRERVLFDPTGKATGAYRQPMTGVPFSRGFVIDRDGRVALPYFGHRPELAIRTIYGLIDYRGSDPRPPRGGFPVREVLDRVHAFADGYKTKLDLRLPDPGRVRTPALGWPSLLLVHGLGGSRKAVAAEALRYTKLGYVTIAYDVRGQGETRSLNSGGGSTLLGGVEKADMAELFHAARAMLGGWMDFRRLGVKGTSQGGAHAWAAAAWSGHRLPVRRGNIADFPEVRVAAAGGATADWSDIVSPERNAFSGRAILKFFASGGGLTLEPGFRQKGQQLFAQQDFAGWAALVRGPGRQDRAWVARSRVPVFAHNSWDDWWLHPNSMVDLAATMPATTPRYVHLGTGNHGSPRNLHEVAQWKALERRWCDRFLKGVTDELPAQMPFFLAVTPDDPAVYADPKSLWQHRQAATWPGTGRTRTRTLFLRAKQQLLDRAAATNEAADRVTHRVAAGFTPLAWVRTGNDPAKVLAAVPLSSVPYRSAPLDPATELLGRARATVHLRSAAANLQLHVALFDEDGRGRRRYVTGGFRCIRGRRAGAAVYTVDLGDAAYVFRRGHRLVVAVENHSYHRPPGVHELRTVPYFDSSTFDVEHGPATPSRIDLPLLPHTALGCRAATLTLSRAAGGGVPLGLDGARWRAGSPFAVLISLSGTVPGTDLGGVKVPLNFDALTWVGLAAAGSSLFPGFLGVLDRDGRALAGFVAPAGLLPASFVGLHLSFTALALDASGLSAGPASQVRIDH